MTNNDWDAIIIIVSVAVIRYTIGYFVGGGV